MKQIFTRHFQLYPDMEPRDAVKLAYQSTYGGGHIAPSLAVAQARLKEELSQTTSIPDQPLTEEIGGNRVRLYLSSPEISAFSPESISFLFAEGCRTQGPPEEMDPALSALKELAADGKAPFSSQSLCTFLDEYDALGRPAVSHSETYRRAYRPAYRVMEKDMLRFLPLFSTIDSLLQCKETVTVAIDGMSAAGKSTLGALLTKRYGCSLIHMDDFFLPPELRTPERLATPGGNIHHERFKVQVLNALSSRTAFAYDRFDCHTMSFSEKITVKPNHLTVIEGAYALHPSLRDFYDLKVFFPIEPDKQLDRIRIRNGEACLPRFRDRWIPMENAYLSACRVKECCDLIL